MQVSGRNQVADRDLRDRAESFFRRMSVHVGMTAVLLSTGFPLCGQSHLNALVQRYPVPWKRVEVVIIARGSNVRGSSGNMDSYLALVSRGKGHEETVARLVHYYPSFQSAIPDDEITTRARFHLRVTAAEYCRMDAKDFLIQHVFDEEAVARIREPGEHNTLPCLLIRE
jgi:hypothetical protein